ncbi:MAG TPA: GxxExxY protein, partial [Pyrinomonadaceae bacterium]
YQIVGIAYKVRDELGFGFLEKVYENALAISLRENGLTAVQQMPLNVMFHDQVVGVYCPDVMVEDRMILEIKSCDRIISAHKAQTLDYLKATGMKLGIILNFAKQTVEFERLVL